MKSRRVLIQRLLMAAGGVGIIAIIVMFITYRQITRHPEQVLDLIQKQADMHLDKIQQTATKNGVREWYLEARSATLRDGQKQVHLDHPEVEFFMEDSDNVHLSADQGVIYTDSNRITLSGHVFARTAAHRFDTELLDYDPEHRELRADTPVTLTGDGVMIRARRMTINLDTRVVLFKGRVEGIIHDGFTF
ncbi:LPS export ABC transporter periplasmic protein LptC [Desulfosarcina sp. OttesenSCG-928-G10]|nr:LPS export ABC transporter periplasmic protein LptC [Desulfosarcina sp. OttesenSCG-928-G10]MDL2321098.1 LPS export ABC transporter periplasmic protein LptC [Desulfosarcina sp. OttesenSCG-928-B08]